MCTVLQSASSAIRPGCVWQPSCGSLTPSSTGSDQLNCHMDEALSLLYGGKHTADVVLVVKEEAPLFCSDKENTKPAAKKQKTSAAQQTDCSKAVSATMLAHKALLWRMSEYFQYKFVNWSNDVSSNEKPEVVLLVPAGQLEVGKALVVAMYSQVPNNISQQQLMQLLTLAESYRITPVVHAVIQRVYTMPTWQLTWGAVLYIHQLPTAEQLYAPVKAAATRRLLQVLGDLELVWALEQPQQSELVQQQLMQQWRMGCQHRHSVAKGTASAAETAVVEAADKANDAILATVVHQHQPLHTLLLQLPFQLLLELLSSAESKVASEDTVHYTIGRWLQQHPEATDEQRRQLAEQVQLRFCTRSYLLNEVCDMDSWLSGLLSTQALVRQTALCLQPTGLLGLDQFSVIKSSRRRSQDTVLQKLQLAWNVPLSDIRSTYIEAVRENNNCPDLYQQETYQWQGRQFSMRIEITMQDCEDPNQPGQIEGLVDALSMLVDVERDACSLGHGSYYSVKFTAWGRPATDGAAVAALQRTCGRAAKQQGVDYISEQLYLMYSGVYCPGDHVEAAQQPACTDVCHNWQELEAALVRQGLVHPDGCLHLTAEIWDVC